MRLTGWLRCRTAAEAAAVAANVDEHVRLSRAEPGCLLFDIRPTDDPLVWRVEECFASPLAFAEHQARTRASDWIRATEGITRDFAARG